MQTISRKLARETTVLDPIDHERLCVSMEPHDPCLTIWCKGRRTKYRVGFAAIYRLAIQSRIEDFRRAKAQEKAGKRRRASK